MIISLGTRLSIPMMGYVEKEFARNAKIIYVDIDKTEYSKFDNRKKFLFYNDDVKNFLTFVLKKLKFKKYQKNNWLKYCEKTLKSFPT